MGIPHGGWLERQGYDVTYSSSVDTHRICPAGKGIKMFLSVGHDEYWSVPQRANVEAARERGVNLGFFAANVCFHRIIYEADGRAFSEDRHGLNGLWRGPVVNNPEISMIGEEYVLNFGFFRPNGNITMPGTLPSGSGIGGYHWAYDYSGLTNGQALSGLLGQEIDGCWDVNSNACDDVGGVQCPSPNTIKLADSAFKSCVVGGITNTGHSYVTLYTACGGAQVFATGAWQWNWGLDDFASDLIPGPSRVSPAAQQMTHNVLRTFSGRPTAPVTFTNADSITSGNWTNHYGSEGYWIADNTSLTNLPAYAQITITNQHVQVWTTDTRALLKPAYYTNRIAAAWTTTDTQNSSFTIDLNLTDTNKHSIALYCVDWLGTGTVLQKIEVFDSTDTSFSHALDTRSFQLPGNGVYLVWNLKGHKIFRIVKPDSTTGNKAMVSGLFIGD